MADTDKLRDARYKIVIPETNVQNYVPDPDDGESSWIQQDGTLTHSAGYRKLFGLQGTRVVAGTLDTEFISEALTYGGSASDTICLTASAPKHPSVV